MSFELVKNYLTERGYGDRAQEFTVSSATVELAAAALGCEGARIAKTLSFKTPEGVVLIVAAGDAKVDNHKYKEKFHTKAKMLTPEEAVELALKNGKITPAQRGWAKGYALKSPDGFKEFLEKAPQAVPMSEIAGGDALALKGDKPDEATMLVCKQLGVSAEDVQKYGMKEE